MNKEFHENHAQLLFDEDLDISELDDPDYNDVNKSVRNLLNSKNKEHTDIFRDLWNRRWND